MSKYTESWLSSATRAVAVLLVVVAGCASDKGGVTGGGGGGTDLDDLGGISAPDAASGVDVPQGSNTDVSIPVADVPVSADMVSTDTVTGCADGTACDDGDPCTKDDVCAGGTCAGTPYTCDDGRDCTTDACDGFGGCSLTIDPAFCLVGNQCIGEGDPGGGCASCQPDVSQTELSPVGGNDEPCDDGDGCTVGDHCAGTACVGEPVDCDDANLCTVDSCDGVSGCVHAPTLGACDDGDACTTSDQCEGGECVGVVPVNCNDDNACTKDACDAVNGCTHEDLTGTCSDGDACTVGDVCAAGECVPGDVASCDDGNSCTADACDTVQGCTHALVDDPCCQGGANVCDDSDPCTLDLCDPLTSACSHEPLTGACNDGDPCTSGDTCQGGACVGTPKVCDDGNPCTSDACEGFGKCVSTPLSGTPCDDGKACSTGDACDAGVCVADTSACVCQPELSPAVSKITALQIGANGKPGNGLDVDGNPATCSPPADCSAGIDNTLSAVSSLANPSLSDAVQKGSIVLLLEHAGLATDGTPYTINFFTASPVGGGCDIQTQPCAYNVSKSAFDLDCNALVSFEGAKIVGTKLTAGGPGTTFPFELPISGLQLTVTIYNAKLEATVTVQGSEIPSMTGLIAGAVRKDELKAAISALPEDQFPAGFSKDTILSFLDLLVQNDIDTDGDGTMDAASIGIPFDSISGIIAGVK